MKADKTLFDVCRNVLNDFFIDIWFLNYSFKMFGRSLKLYSNLNYNIFLTIDQSHSLLETHTHTHKHIHT